MKSAEHNVSHLKELQGFKKIFAPYAGVITARNATTGMLVDAGGSNGAKELFHIAATSKLRLFVNVPEIYSRAIKPGLSADFVLAEHPGRRFAGVLVRTADAIDVASRTFLSEFQMDNPNGEILTGAHAQARLKIPVQATAFFLPVNTLIFRADGLQAAKVLGDNRVALVKITLGRDYGKEVEVVDGLRGDESVVLDPPDSLLAGAAVRVVKPSP